MTPREIHDAMSGHSDERRADRAVQASIAASLANLLAPPGRLTQAIQPEQFLSDTDRAALHAAQIEPLAQRAAKKKAR